MAKSEKQAPAEEPAEKPKSKKLLLIIVALLVLGIAGGAGWYFTKGSHPADETKKEEQKALLDQPKFIALEPFTVNLQREQGDQFLQAGISLKIYDAELEEKIKANLPEIRDRLLRLLSSKRASELSTPEGKDKLATEIMIDANSVLGIKKLAPKTPTAPAAASAVTAASAPEGTEPAAAEGEQAAATEAPAAEPAAAENNGNDRQGIVAVLFTSFIIQ